MLVLKRDALKVVHSYGGYVFLKTYVRSPESLHISLLPCMEVTTMDVLISNQSNTFPITSHSSNNNTDSGGLT